MTGKWLETLIVDILLVAMSYGPKHFLVPAKWLFSTILTRITSFDENNFFLRANYNWIEQRGPNLSPNLMSSLLPVFYLSSPSLRELNWSWYFYFYSSWIFCFSSRIFCFSSRIFCQEYILVTNILSRIYSSQNIFFLEHSFWQEYILLRIF